MWNHMLKNDKSLNEKYPNNNCDKIYSFIKHKNLPDNFYPCFHVSYQLYNVLKKKDNFQTLKEKYNIYLKNVPTVDIPIKYKKALKEIYLKINNLDHSFENIKIKFKQFTYEKSRETCYNEDDTFYFSHILLNENINKEWRSFILGKCLEMLPISTSKIVSYFNIID